MRLDTQFAEKFAAEWIAAWNERDLERIMAPYAHDIEFHSPSIRVVMKNDINFLKGTVDLKQYWSRAIELLPDLHFEFRELFLSSDALTISYSNERGQTVAETFMFDELRKVSMSIAAKR